MSVCLIESPKAQTYTGWELPCCLNLSYYNSFGLSNQTERDRLIERNFTSINLVRSEKFSFDFCYFGARSGCYSLALRDMTEQFRHLQFEKLNRMFKGIVLHFLEICLFIFLLRVRWAAQSYICQQLVNLAKNKAASLLCPKEKKSYL